MEKSRPATSNQRAQLLALLESGKIDRAAAARLIYAFGGVSHWRKWTAVQAFDPAFMRGFFCPLYYGKRLGLKPLLSDLETRLRRAVFWGDLGSHRIVRWNEFAGMSSDAFTPLYDSFPAHGAPEWVWDAVMSHFDSLLESRIAPAFRKRLERVEDEFTRSAVTTSISDSFMNPCMLGLMENSKESEKYDALHELWQAGNYPFGYDKNDEGSLLVLVAD